jgi:UDP-glucose 4-epimerase
MAKILITGGAGFIGYFVAEKLSQNPEHQVTILDNLSRGRNDEEFETLCAKPNVTFIQGDLTSQATLDDISRDYEYVYHLAALVGVKNVKDAPDRVLSVNIRSTLNLFEAARSFYRLRKIFFSSTSEVYAGTFMHFAVGVPTSESVPLAVSDITSARSTYAISKMCGESICFSYGKKYQIPFVIGRYHNVYGPRMGWAHVIPEMYAKIINNTELTVTSPGHSRAFCYIDDAVEFTVRLTEHYQTEGEIFHIGNPAEEIRIKDLVKLIARVMNRQVFVETGRDMPGSPHRRCPDTAKAERRTGYRAEIALEEGVKKTYQWYQSRLDSYEEGR